MKHKYLSIFQLSLVLFGAILSRASAQPAAAASADPAVKSAVTTPFLWKIEGGPLRQPSHLFGTIHVGTPEIRKLRAPVEKALNEADVLVTEVSFDPAEQMKAVRLFLRSDGTKLGDSVGEEVMKSLGAALREINPALGPEPFEMIKTWVVAATVTMLPHQLAGEKALDAILWERAIGAGKQGAALESAESQVKAFEVLSEAEQAVYLRSVLEERKKQTELLKGMVDAYGKGQEDKVRALMDESIRDLGEDPKVRRIGEKLLASLLTERDRSMAEAIDKRLRAEPGKRQFIAVGAAHLLGGQGICRQLAAKGWKITRVAE
jgi:uncharacterized protein YbaP (TraB family)